MDELIRELAAQKARTCALQVMYRDEKLLRLKTEDRLRELRRLHQTLACSCEMSEEFIVNKVRKPPPIRHQGFRN